MRHSVVLPFPPLVSHTLLLLLFAVVVVFRCGGRYPSRKTRKGGRRLLDCFLRHLYQNIASSPPISLLPCIKNVGSSIRAKKGKERPTDRASSFPSFPEVERKGKRDTERAPLSFPRHSRFKSRAGRRRKKKRHLHRNILLIPSPSPPFLSFCCIVGGGGESGHPKYFPS